MTIGNNTHQVDINDYMFVLSNAPHGLLNDGDSKSVLRHPYPPKNHLNLLPLNCETDSK